MVEIMATTAIGSRGFSFLYPFLFSCTDFHYKGQWKAQTSANDAEHTAKPRDTEAKQWQNLIENMKLGHPKHTFRKQLQS